MAPVTLSVIFKPQVSKNIVTAVFKTTIAASNSILQKDKRIRTSFTQYGSQSSTTIYPKRTYATSTDAKGKKFDADLKVTGTIQQSSSAVPSVKKEMPASGSNNDGKSPPFSLCEIYNALSVFLDLESKYKVMNKYRWTDLEKCLLKQKLLSLNKKVEDLTREDYADLSDAVYTRSLTQCKNFVNYHYK